jgi:hypothetical protein
MVAGKISAMIKRSGEVFNLRRTEKVVGPPPEEVSSCGCFFMGKHEP